MRALRRGKLTQFFLFLTFLHAVCRLLIKLLRHSGRPAFVRKRLHYDSFFIKPLPKNEYVAQRHFPAGFGAMTVNTDFTAFDRLTGE